MHYFESGMFVHEPAWHAFGNVVFEWPGTWEAAATLAGINWDVESRDLAFDGYQDLGWKKLDSYKAIVRDDTNEVLHVAGKDYEPIQNRDFGEVIEIVMSGATGQTPQFDALVSLRGGRVIAATMLTGQTHVPGDPSPLAQYVVFYTSHDGSYAFRCGPNSIRVVCANTQRAAEDEFNRTKSSWSFRHTSGWKDRLESVKDGLSMVLRSHEVYAEAAAELAAANISDERVTEFVDRWIPYSTDMTARQMANVMEQRDTFWELYRGELGEKTLDGIRGTKWGVYQAAVEMRDHYSRYHNSDTLISRVLLRGDDSKPRALKILESV